MNFDRKHVDHHSLSFQQMLDGLCARWLGMEDIGRANERLLRDQGFIADCELEFGPHDDHGDCERIMAEMSGDSMTDYLMWEQEAYSREAQEMSLGRPLFPNEY